MAYIWEYPPPPPGIQRCNGTFLIQIQIYLQCDIYSQVFNSVIMLSLFLFIVFVVDLSALLQYLANDKSTLFPDK